MKLEISDAERARLLELVERSRYDRDAEAVRALDASSLSEAEADRLRELSIDLQTELGFDESYALNEDGIFLQVLIDRYIV